MNKRPCYPSDRVCVVLCVSPIVSASCESGVESLSWPPYQLWQDVPLTRMCVCVSLGLRGCPPLCLSVSELACCILPHIRQFAFVTSCNLLHLSLVTAASSIPGSAQLEASTAHEHVSICIVCQCICIKVYPYNIVAKGSFMHQLYCPMVTLSAASLLYE